MAADPTVIEIVVGGNTASVEDSSETIEVYSDSRDANSIRNRPVETGTPADQEVLTYSTSASEWIYQTVAENVDDQVASLLQSSSGNGLTWSYNDSAGTLTPVLSLINADINASAAIAVSKLAASTVNYGGVTLTLGGSDTTPAFNLSDATAYVGDSALVTSGALNSGSITSGFGSIDVGSSAVSGGTGTFTQVDITAEGDLRLQDNSGGQYVGMDAPATVSSSYVLTMPAAVGSVSQVLSLSNTDGTLAWTTPEVGDITSVVAGAGMTGGGTSGDVTLNVIGTSDKITVSSDAITIASGYVGQTSITTLGTVGTGTWQGSTLAVGYGGTGATSLTDGGVLLGSGTGAISAMAVLGDGVIIIGDNSGDPTTLDVGSSSAITILGTIATGAWQGTSISTSYTDAKVTSVVAGTLVDVSSTTGDVTVNVDLSELATSTSDADGDFFAVVDSSNAQKKLTKGNISLAGFTGTAATATTASVATTVTITDNESTNESNGLVFTSGGTLTGNLGLESDGTVTYNPSTGKITATGFVGALTGDASGNAATATALETARTIGGTSFDGTGNIAVGLAATATALATGRTIGGTSFDGTANIVPATITVADTTNTSCSVGLFESATGSLAPKSDGGLTYNAGTGTLTATAFAGPLSGNVTGNASGTAGVATTVTITDNESTNENNGLVFTSGGTLTGNLGLESDGTTTYNPSTGKITATGFIGALTGDASGNSATATALETARTIGGTSFNGTANIAVGLAATATALATARAINGVDFDGTGAVTVTAAAGTLSGGTLASGVTASSLTSVGTLTSLTTSGNIVVGATDKIYLDNGGNTYLVESAGDTISLVAGGTTSVSVTATGTSFNDLAITNVGDIALDSVSSDGSTAPMFYGTASAGATEIGNAVDNAALFIRSKTGTSAGMAIGVTSGGDAYLQGCFADNSGGKTIILNPYGDNVQVTGSLSKGGGSFLIPHPLPSMNDTHNLVHSFVEGPRADLIYRDSVTLSGGAASVDLDEVVGMTDGTWELLCRDPQVYLQNDTGWSAVKGSVSGSTLIISCENTNSIDTISWMVVAERQDDFMKASATDFADSDGRVILEPLKRQGT